MGRREQFGSVVSASGDATAALAAATSASNAATAAGVLASAAVVKATAVFDQTANSTTLAIVPAAVNIGAMTLLTEAITAIGTLQAAINADRQLINRLINIVRGAG